MISFTFSTFILKQNETCIFLDTTVFPVEFESALC